MKIINLLLIGGMLLGCSITSKTPCSDYGLYVLFHNFDTSKGDTVVHYAAYVKGNNFSYAVDSSAIPIDFVAQLQTVGVRPELASLKSNFDQYDWKFVFRPSGKTFLIKEITFHQVSVAQPKYKDHACTNDLTFKVNDSLYKMPGKDGVSTQYIRINY